MAQWQFEEAKEQFRRVVALASSEGPQVVTRHGKEVAVIVGISDYRRMRSDGGTFKRFLAEAPNLAALEIDRARELAPVVEP